MSDICPADNHTDTPLWGLPRGGPQEHEWVAPVERHADGSLELIYPLAPTAVEQIHAIRGQLVARMVYCRHCGAKPEEA